MKKILISFLIAGIVFTGCKQNTIHKENDLSSVAAQEKKHAVRYGMVTGLKPEKLGYYKDLHAKPWPAVVAKIKECNIENYSIYLQKIANQYYLFSYFEYTGNDFDSDMKKMAADTTTQRWWKETDPCQRPLPDAMAKKQIWSEMGEVFHVD